MFLITAVQDLELEGREELNEPFLLVEGIYLAWTPSYIQGLISSGMQAAMGGLEYLNLTDGGHLACFSHVHDDAYRERPLAALSAWHSNIHDFLHCLWLIKDNSSNTDVGFVESRDRQGEDVASSNLRASVYVCADGCRRTSRYSSIELADARQLCGVFNHMTSGIYEGVYPPTLTLKDQVEPSGRVIAAKEVRPFTRAWFFISAARDCSDLSTKVAHYCTCLEVLFSTDATEISHKLAERVALFLGETFDERKRLFYLVKRLYSVRSSLVHGDALSRDGLKNLEETSQAADDLLRRVLRRIMEDSNLHALFEGSKEGRERFFVDLVLR